MTDTYLSQPLREFIYHTNSNCWDLLWHEMSGDVKVRYRQESTEQGRHQQGGGIALETRDVKTVAETFRIPMLL